MDQDPLLKFLSTVADKIKVEKEHKTLMENINNSKASLSGAEETEPLANVLELLQQKIKENLVIKDIVKDEKNDLLIEDNKEEILVVGNNSEEDKPVQAVVHKNNIIEDIKIEEDNSLNSFLLNLKSIIARKTTQTTIKTEEIEKAQEEIIDSDELSKDENTINYIDDLDKLSTNIAREEDTSKVSEIKKLISEYAEKYFKKAAVMSEYAGGGGTNAVQYARGGTMDGTLNVNGQILSGGRDISNYFGSGGGGGGGDPAVNTAVYTGSARWDSTYTNTNYFSAFWNAAVDELFTFYVTQTDPGSAFISEDGNYYIIANSKLDNVSLWNNVFTQVYLLSSQWSSVYVTVLGTSARWDSVYTSFNENSGRYESVYNTTQTSSGSWSSVYNTYQSLSASYAAETLAIAYAVAL